MTLGGRGQLFVTSDVQWTQNLYLIRDNLRHLRVELSMDSPFWFRVGKEAYQTLCRSMVEALRGSANLAITGSRRPRNRRIHYRFGDTMWKMIEKSPVPGCHLAWRFSHPVPRDPPQAAADGQRTSDDNLIGFFDLLAMIQTECFMCRMVEGRPVVVTDQDIRQLEWLHESIRNEFEHFMPKLYGADFEDLQRGATIALDLSRRLFAESGTVFLGRDTDVVDILENSQALLRRVLAGPTQPMPDQH
jgi:hypothetical protein